MRTYDVAPLSSSRRVVAVLTIFFLLFGAPCSSFAQSVSDPNDLSLEELLDARVFSASKYAQDANEAPSSITILSSDEIRKNGYRRLIDILGTLTGFYVTNHGNYSTLGVRGFAPQENSSSNRILVLVNGHAVNNNIDDSAPIQEDFPVDLELIDRIEIVRGPNSSVYGADAFFAVVNVITKTGANAKGTTVSTEAGSFGAYKTTATYAMQRGGTQALFSESYSVTDAPEQLGNIVDPVHLSSAHDQSRRLFGLVSSHGFTFQAAVSSLQQPNTPSSQWCGACHVTASHGTDFRGYADLQYQHRLLKNGDFTFRTYYDTLSTHANRNVLRGNLAGASCANSCHGDVLDHDTAHGDRVGAELKFSDHLTRKLLVSGGAEYRDNFRQEQHNYIDGFVKTRNGVTTTSADFVDYNRTSALWGIYGEGEYQFSRKLVATAGVRNDRYNYIGDSTNPRASLVYTPVKGTTLKFFYGSAFRAPSFYELYYAAMDAVSAPTLLPEHIHTGEVVVEQKLGRRASLIASGFYNSIENYISQTTTVINGKDRESFQNLPAKAKGIEVELNGRLKSGVEGRLSYTYQDAWNTANDTWLLDSPRHLVKMDLSGPVVPRILSGSIESQFMSGMMVSPTYFNGTPPNYYGTPVSLNATLTSKQLWHGLSASGGVYNLVGRSLGDPMFGYYQQTTIVHGATSLLPEDRRTFRVKLTWTSGGESVFAKHSAAHATNTQSEAQIGDAYASR